MRRASLSHAILPRRSGRRRPTVPRKPDGSFKGTPMYSPFVRTWVFAVMLAVPAWAGGAEAPAQEYMDILLDLGVVIGDDSDEWWIRVFSKGRMDSQIEEHKKRVEKDMDDLRALDALAEQRLTYSRATVARWYCWRCKQEVPVLNDDGAAILDSLYRGGLVQARATSGVASESPSMITPRDYLHPALAEFRRAYRDMTGEDLSPKCPLLHHKRSDFGPPCPACGKPLRSATASQCFLCGWKG
jgi:hypothetical protein